MPNERIYFVSSERGWSRSLSPHPVNSLRNSEDNEEFPKPSNTAAEPTSTQPPPMLPCQQEVTNTSAGPIVPFDVPRGLLHTEDNSHPPPLPPRLPKLAQNLNNSQKAILSVDDIVSGNKETSFTAQKYPNQPNGKVVPSDQQQNSALLLGANLNPPQIIRSPRIENRDKPSSQQGMKRDSYDLWDDSISQRTTQKAELVRPPAIFYSPTPWKRKRDLESSTWDRNQFRIEAEEEEGENSLSAELLPPGLFSSPRAGKSQIKKESLMERQGENGTVETRDTDTQTEDEDGTLHRARSRDRRKRPPLLRSSAKFTGSFTFLPSVQSALSDEHIYEATHHSSAERIYEDLQLFPPRY